MANALKKALPAILLVVIMGLTLTGCASDAPVDDEFIINNFFPNVWIFVAQILAMIILFIVLYKFVYKKGNETVSKFQDDVKKEIEDAEKANVEAHEKLEEINKKYLESHETALKIISDAEEDARKNIELINKDARANIDQMYEVANQNIKIHEETFEQTKRDDIVDIALFAAEKVLEKEIDVKKHKELIDDAISQFGE